MAADDMMTLGLDATQHNDAAAQAESAHERLIGSSHRVAGRIGHLSDEFYKGGGAAGVFGKAIIAAEQSLNLPLSSLGFLAGIGYFVSEVAKAGAESAKLKKEIEDLARSGNEGGQFKTLESLNKQLDETKKKLAELKGQESGGFFKSLFGALGSTEFLKGFASEGLSGGPFSGLFSGLKGGQKRLEAERLEEAKQARDAKGGAEADIADKKAEENEELRGKLDFGEGSGAAELRKIDKKEREELGKAGDNAGLQQEIIAGAQLERDAINQKVAAKEREYALEEKLAEIKKTGKDVEVESAKAKLQGAIDEDYFSNKDEKPKTQAKIREAEAGVAGAESKAAAKDRESSLGETVADIKEKGGEHEKVNVAEAKLAAAVEAQAAAVTDEERDKSLDDVSKARGDLAEALRDEEKKALQYEKDENSAAARKKVKQDKLDKIDSDFAKNPTGLSLHEIATKGAGLQGAEAREATREEQLAKQLQLQGNTRLAAEHQSHAEKLKQSLGLPSKEDAKDNIKKGLDESETLKQIRDNTANAGANK